ncbi:unnamed protein product [Rhizophagus irregularis]|nr:unnamed protein product [Rhizophagus irregularis]
MNDAERIQHHRSRQKRESPIIEDTILQQSQKDNSSSAAGLYRVTTHLAKILAEKLVGLSEIFTVKSDLVPIFFIIILLNRISNQVLDHSIIRSEVYKSINFKQAMIENLLYPAHKVSEIPKPVREYLTKNQRPDSKSAEDVVQTWFIGLRKVSSSAWKSVTAVDTYMPDISVLNNDDAVEGLLFPFMSVQFWK